MAAVIEVDDGPPELGSADGAEDVALPPPVMQPVVSTAKRIAHRNGRKSTPTSDASLTAPPKGARGLGRKQCRGMPGRGKCSSPTVAGASLPGLDNRRTPEEQRRILTAGRDMV